MGESMSGTFPSGVESVCNSLVCRAQEYNIFVADLSRDVTSQQLLVGTLVCMYMCVCVPVCMFYVCVCKYVSLSTIIEPHYNPTGILPKTLQIREVC